MAVQTLDILRRWLRGRVVDEYHWDDIRQPLLEWSDSLVNDINQIRLDLFGSSYSIDNDGLANLSNPIYNSASTVSAVPWIFSNSVTFSSSVTYSGTTTFSGNVRIFSGFDLLMYSDAGTTLKASIDGATGNAAFAGTMAITGTTNFGADVIMNFGGLFQMFADAGVTGTLEIDGSAGSINATGLISTGGDLFASGDLDVNGGATIGGEVTISDITKITGNVSIGATTTADSKLHLFSGSAGSVASLTGTLLTIEASSASVNYQNFLSPNTATQGILFGDADDNDVGRFLYDHGTNSMSFYTAATSRLTINNAGLAAFAAAVTVGTTLGVTGATTLSSTLSAGASTLASASISGAATVGTTLGVTGATTLGSTLSIPTATKAFLDGGSNTSIRESASDIITFEVGGSDRLALNSAAVTNSFMTFSNTAQTTGNIINIPNADSLTTGSILNLVSASAGSTNPLVYIAQNGGASTGYCLTLSTQGLGTNLYVENLSAGNCIEMLSLGNAASDTYGIKMNLVNSGAGNTIGIDFSATAVNFAFQFTADATDPTGGGGAATGRIPVRIGGATRYLAYY